ncbi:type II CRISPR RNA-guided endonuclease Cas9 [Fusobacterium pseudoperiodonticum]|uniref:type II CRISPR RNA-guided endonuclease Cas9 n=1 Tax=Fusobacterium pseudoperiodonticum TaxID=2663009 RepID=UPI000C1B8E32|nr:type II CRISPR RNA-guided endonuclease Cas9 [Fusobacterium pseudoperiodonticum]ATV57973.1 type II CRISPR RNA-guided endonuclease Cas9 [Fusobacterium pseudoperiodonticum]
MKKQQFSDYYLGFDIGTNSVGWCVTDLNYNVLRFNKKDMWGSRLFDEAKTAAERRVQRNSRRRLKRRKWRLNLLEEIFSDEILRVDSNFFRRLKESSLWLEDKSSKEKFTLFNDDNYKDYDFYKQYPTIFHLRNELIKNPEKKDIRLVYLALHSIFKSRGHFLFEGQNLKDIKNFETLYNNLIAFLEDNDIYKNIDSNYIGNLENIICDSKKGLKDKEKEFKEIFNSDKQLVAFFKLSVGSSVSLNDLFDTDEYKKGEVEKEKISFREQIYEDDKPIYYSILGEKIEFLDIAKSFYDFMVLNNILADSQYISEAKVKLYDEHKRDLKNLKYIIKKYNKENYDKLFKDKIESNYSAYIGLNKEKGKKEVIEKSRLKIDDFAKIIKGYLPKAEKIDEKDRSIFNEILDKIELKTILPKQRISDNGTLPYQIHEAELEKILENQAKYYDFLNHEENGVSTKDKLIMTFKFRIPYYVGPLNSYHKNKGGNSWIVRKEEGKILPWNFEQKVDIEKSAEEFIKRMTNKCTYLNGEDVIPKDSFLYSEYIILNELNKVQVNDEFLNKEIKNKIIENLFKKSKKISEKNFKEYLLVNQIANKTVELKGVKDAFNSNYVSYIKFKDIFGDKLNLDIYKEISEKSILWKCLYGDDKKIFEKKIKSEYGDILTKEEIKKINSFKFNTWGRLSEKLLTGIEFIDLETGECYSSVMDALRRTNYNLMELLSSKFTLQENIDNENKEVSEFSYRDLVEESYVSPSLKRAILQTLKIYEEIRKITGRVPKKVFIEMARGGDETMKNKKIPARQEQLKKLYDSCGKDISNFSIDIKEIKNSLNSYDNNSLRQKKLYLYYLQFGKSMYSGKEIDLNRLLQNNDTYDIDHIYPRSKIVKDDSFDNLALVLKDENAKKGNEYPIDKDIQANMKSFWKFLKEKNFISDEKYKRLTGTSELEVRGFMARQLVNVRQTTKEVGKILQQIEPEIKIVYSKAEIASSFREMFDFIKVRELNDTHHAKDAYLNIVAGNVYNTKFTEKPYRYLQEIKENYDVKKIYNYDIKNAWDKEKSLEIVKRNMEKNTVNITRFIKEEKGELFDVTISKKGNSKEIVAIKPKLYSGELDNLSQKYGYYTSLKAAYFIYVEHEVKNKRVKTFERITRIDSNLVRDEKNLVEYLVDKKNLVNPKIIKKILKEQTLIINDYPYTFTGIDARKQVELKNKKQLYLETKYEKILKNALKFVEDNQGKSEENYKFIYLKKKDRNEKNETIESVKERYNIEFNGMYDKFLEKLDSKDYKNYINNKLYTNFLKSKEEFKKLNLWEKSLILREFLKIFNKDTYGRYEIKDSQTKEKLFSIPNETGRIRIGQSSLGNNKELVEESVTGLFVKKIKL